MRCLCLCLCLLATFPAAAQPVSSEQASFEVEVFAEGLEHPWSLVFLPDGSLLVSERAGRLRHLSTSGALSEPLAGVAQVTAEGQGGLLGLALDPAFAENRRLFYCHSEARDGGLATSVSRATLNDDSSALENAEVIFRQLPVGDTDRHFGCRLVFDQSGALFVTLGDRGNLSDLAQDPATHIGKVLRLTTEGAAAPGNPLLPGWAPEVWSLGHRNAQGATVDPLTGRLLTAEHGAQGGDEINAPEAGKNYGWPIITYGRDYSGTSIGEGTHKEGLEQPLTYWDPSIAPSGMTVYQGTAFPNWQGDIFVGALAGRKLVRLERDGLKILGEEALLTEMDERIRDVVTGPEGYLYLLTDSDEGHVLRLVPR